MKEEVYPKTMLFTWLKTTKKRTSNDFDTQGMSMIEILIVVAIIAILGAMALVSYNRQLSKARDAQRKDHMEDLRVAFEDYYNDNECYPDLEMLSNCGGSDLSPYLKEIPCDPQDELPYVGSSFGDDWCDGYRVLVQLENVTDPSIERIGCNAVTGCEYIDPTYNYGIAMGGIITAPDWEPEPTPTPIIPTATTAPTPTMAPGAWVIAPDGTCSYYTFEYLPTGGCPDTYGSFDECFAISGCTNSCTEDDVPLELRCER
jgi:prepilin-type N-terminal cleavage/methylation domain-containing protein